MEFLQNQIHSQKGGGGGVKGKRRKKRGENAFPLFMAHGQNVVGLCCKDV